MKYKYICRNEKCKSINVFDAEVESFEMNILEILPNTRRKSEDNRKRTYIVNCPQCGTENKITIDIGLL